MIINLHSTPGPSTVYEPPVSTTVASLAPKGMYYYRTLLQCVSLPPLYWGCKVPCCGSGRTEIFRKLPSLFPLSPQPRLRCVRTRLTISTSRISPPVGLLAEVFSDLPTLSVLKRPAQRRCRMFLRFSLARATLGQVAFFRWPAHARAQCPFPAMSQSSSPRSELAFFRASYTSPRWIGLSPQRFLRSLRSPPPRQRYSLDENCTIPK